MRAKPIAHLVAAAALLSACPPPPPDTELPHCPSGTHLAADSATCLPDETTCPAGTMPTASGAECLPVGIAACGEGFERDASGYACVEIRPEEACGPGTMPVIGERECQPVGWRDCPAGFEPSESGWGCSEILPASPCEGATLERLGQRACAPLGDCGAAFPPAGALLVDDSFTEAEADGVTRFKTLAAALAKAGPGGVVAIEEGSYAEKLTLSSPARLVGRCAQKVVLQGGLATAGIEVTAGKVEVSGVTVTAFSPAASVSGGGELTLSECLLTANRGGVIVRKTGAEAPRLTLRRTAIRSGDSGSAVALLGGVAEVEESVLSGHPAAGLSAGGSASAATVRRSLVRGNGARGNSASANLIAERGASLEVRESAVAASGRWNALASGAGTTLRLDHTALRRPGGDLATSVVSKDGASATLSDCGLYDSPYLGALATEDLAQLSLTRCTLANPEDGSFPGAGIEVGLASARVADTAIVNPRRSGVLGWSGSVALERTLVLGTRGATDASGYQATGVVVVEGGVLDASRSSILDSSQAGLAAAGAGAVATADRVLIEGTRYERSTMAGGGLVVADSARVELTGCALVENESAGIFAGAKSAPGATDPPTLTLVGGVVRDTLPNIIALGTPVGAWVGSGGQATFRGVTFLRNTTAGVGAQHEGTRIELAGCAVLGTRPLPGEFAYGLFASEASEIVAHGTLVRDQPGVGAIANWQARLHLEDSLVEELPLVQDAWGLLAGIGALAVEEGVLDLRRATVRRCGLAALAWANSSGIVAASLVAENAVAIQVQDGTSLRNLATPPSVAPENQVLVGADTTFTENTVLRGSERLDLPELPPL